VVISYIRDVCFVAILLAALSGCAARQEAKESSPDTKPTQMNVGCFGRILPENGTFFVSADTSGGRIPVIEQLRFQAGDQVSRGQILATLSSRPYLEGAVREAEARVGLARARLSRVRAGPLPWETAVIAAEIARLQTQRDAAARDYSRNKPLYDKDFISKAQLDEIDTHVRDIDSLIHQAQEGLKSVGVIRPEDIAIAEQELLVAESELARMKKEVDASVVRSPSNARVLRVIAHAGEPVGPLGIAEFADTSVMVVMAEVYEADIARVHLGQKAEITSPLLPHSLNGEVAWIGTQIERQEALSAEPGSPSDARIFKVKLRVADSSSLAARINAKVNVVIQQ
jgi:HlyD family secretion protein